MIAGAPAGVGGGVDGTSNPQAATENYMGINPQVVAGGTGPGNRSSRRWAKYHAKLQAELDKERDAGNTWSGLGAADGRSPRAPKRRTQRRNRG